MIDRLIDSISPRSCGYMDTICVRRAVLFGGHKLERMLGESHSLTLFLVRHSLVPACAMQPSTCHSSTFCDEDAFGALVLCALASTTKDGREHKQWDRHRSDGGDVM